MRRFHAPRAPLTITIEGQPDAAGAGGPDDDEQITGDRGDELDTTLDDAANGDEGKGADKPSAKDDKPEEKEGGEEGEEEGEETEEERAEREAAEAEAEKAKRIRVPKHRLDEVVAKSRQREEQLLRQIEALSRQQQDKDPPKDVLAEMRTQIGELQDKYEAHVFAGEKDEAKAVRTQLEEAREKYSDARIAATSEATRLQTIDSLKYDAALAKAEADYPVLNPDNADTYDDAKANEVAALMSMFAQNGFTRQASLEKAVRYVMGPPQAREVDTAADTVRLRREQEARKKAAEAQRRQPPSDAGAGTDNDKAGGQRQQGIDIMKLSQEKFAELDEEALARARGDEVA